MQYLSIKFKHFHGLKKDPLLISNLIIKTHISFLIENFVLMANNIYIDR